MRDPLADIPQHTYTRWRDLNAQVDASDSVYPGMPKYVDGSLPAGYVMLVWDGNALMGPRRFSTDEEADQYLAANPGIKKFLLIPSPYDE
jgi:hypothetical protein